MTYDPRGADRSPRTDDAAESTPDEHADDLHQLITALGVAGPVDIFASSGGAVNALTLVAKHPEQVRTLVAHEPPSVRELPDREAAVATFTALVSHEGPLPADFAATLREALAAGHAGGRHSVYEAAGGHPGLLRLARAWHDLVMADEVVSHAFSQGFHPQHNERLAAYWAEALGGPADYSAGYGDETSVVRIHSGNGPHEDMDRRAIACFDQAMQDVGLDETGPLRQVLHDYFAWATTTTMSRYHDSADEVPAGLTIPHWSWDGPQP